MNKLSDVIGKLCETLLPIPEEFYIGNTNSSICVCTLSSIKLLKAIKNSKIIELDSEREFESEMGKDFKLKIFTNTLSGEKHYALVKNLSNPVGCAAVHTLLQSASSFVTA